MDLVFELEPKRFEPTFMPNEKQNSCTHTKWEIEKKECFAVHRDQGFPCVFE